MADPKRPLPRRDQQQRTRDALVRAARRIFARDGYHGARIEAIAHDAGYSKGAVYSNFAGKAELFLAVTDLNLEEGGPNGRPPFIEPRSGANEGGDRDVTELYRDGDARGLALATLEFIAAAARDEALAAESAARIRVLLERYEELAVEMAAEGDDLGTREVAALLAALDQGSALLAVAGATSIDEPTLRRGVRRLLSRSTGTGTSTSTGTGTGTGTGPTDE